MIGYVQPGLGLGFTASRELAYGLGGFGVSEVAVEKAGAADTERAYELSKQYERIRRDDKEVMELIEMIVTSGILDG